MIFSLTSFITTFFIKIKNKPKPKMNKVIIHEVDYDFNNYTQYW